MGQQIVDANIHLPEPILTRELSIDVQWEGKQPPNCTIHVDVEGG
jgi:hypothetical protein